MKPSSYRQKLRKLKSIPSRFFFLRAIVSESKRFKYIAAEENKIYGSSRHLKKLNLKDYIFSEHDKQRINYYLGDIGKNLVVVNTDDIDFKAHLKQRLFSVRNYKNFVEAVIAKDIPRNYSLSVMKVFMFLDDVYKNRDFIYAWGDGSRHISIEGVIGKTRYAHDKSISLLKLNPVWHWSKVLNIRKSDIEYKKKKSMAVWRGANTGLGRKTGTRYELVSRYFSNEKFDIAFSHLVKDHQSEKFSNLLKNKMTPAELLQHKFLICVEGNDVATGLKWMLNSNSVVMMAKPTICSWFMEDQLQPYIHYIPLKNDFSDLNEKCEWAMDNEDICLEITNNASQYIAPFLDAQRELAIECEVMKRYLDNLQVV